MIWTIILMLFCWIPDTEDDNPEAELDDDIETYDSRIISYTSTANPRYDKWNGIVRTHMRGLYAKLAPGCKSQYYFDHTKKIVGKKFKDMHFTSLNGFTNDESFRINKDCNLDTFLCCTFDVVHELPPNSVFVNCLFINCIHVSGQFINCAFSNIRLVTNSCIIMSSLSAIQEIRGPDVAINMCIVRGALFNGSIKVNSSIINRSCVGSVYFDIENEHYSANMGRYTATPDKKELDFLKSHSFITEINGDYYNSSFYGNGEYLDLHGCRTYNVYFPSNGFRNFSKIKGLDTYKHYKYRISEESVTYVMQHFMDYDFEFQNPFGEGNSEERIKEYKRIKERGGICEETDIDCG